MLVGPRGRSRRGLRSDLTGRGQPTGGPPLDSLRIRRASAPGTLNMAHRLPVTGLTYPALDLTSSKASTPSRRVLKEETERMGLRLSALAQRR